MNEEAEVAPEGVEAAAVDAPEASPTPPEPVPTAREAVQKAMKAPDAEEAPEPKPETKAKAAPKPEAKPEAKVEAEPAPEAKAPEAEAPEDGDRPRNPDGTFKAKDAADDVETPEAVEAEPPEKADKLETDAPSRFSPDAKAAWKDAPEPVRREVDRMRRELEGGLEQYRQKFEPLKEYEQLAQQHNTTLKEALDNYTGIERKLAQDPIAGLNQICENVGLSLRDVAAHIMGQKPDQAASQNDATIRSLKQEIAELKQGFGTVQKTFQEQRETATMAEVTQFAAAHPRFDELSEAIAEEIKHGYDLEKAYERAERLNPAPVAPAASAAPAPAAQPRKPNLSVTGAPASGSNPANRGPAPSARDAVKRAFAG